jgi:hypothetical protein
VKDHEPLPEPKVPPHAEIAPSPTARALSPAGLLALQRLAGNRAARTLVQRAQVTPPRQVLARGTYVEVYKQALVAGKSLRLSIIKRPTNQTDALSAIVDDIWAKQPDVSQTELQLAHDAGYNKATAKNLVIWQNWLSKNNAAVCHKLAISVFMGHLQEWVSNLYDNIVFGVPAVGDAELANLIAKMTVGNPGHPARGWFQQLRQYRTPPLFVASDYAYAKSTMAAVDGLCDSLVRELNRAPDNLYIGNAPANSWIQDYFDPHVPMDPANAAEVQATPRSQDIYEAEHRFAASYAVAPSSPRREMDVVTNEPMYATSSVISNVGYHPWNYPPANPGGGWYPL